MRNLHFLLSLSFLWLLLGCQPITRFPEPLKVGLLLPLEGERRELGYSLLPPLLAATPATIQGRPVEWVILDTHSDPATAARRARDLVTDPAVLYVVGPLLAAEAEAVQPVLAEAGLAWLPLVPAADGGGWRTAWAGECWVAQQLEPTTTPGCTTVALPTDTSAYQTAVGNPPTPLGWLVWDATTFMMNQLTQAAALDRATIHQTATPYQWSVEGSERQ